MRRPPKTSNTSHIIHRWSKLTHVFTSLVKLSDLNYSNKRSLCLSASSSKMPVKQKHANILFLLNVLLNIKYKNKVWKPCFRLEFRNVHRMQHFTNLQLCWNILCGFGFKVCKNCLQPKLAIKNDNFEIHQKLWEKVKFSNIFLSYFVNFWRTDLKPF